MNERVLTARKSLLFVLLTLIFSTAIISVPTIAQTTPGTTVFLDPPSVTGVTIDEELTVNIRVSTDKLVKAWMAGLTFNATLLECINVTEGEFLKSVGDTYWITAIINNTEGVITAHGSTLLGNLYTTGSGRLAYVTLKVKAPGVSDLHLRDVKVVEYGTNKAVPSSIIDVYTVILDTTHHTVVTVSNSTGRDTISGIQYGSGFYDHTFNASEEEIGFKVTGPYLGFSNVTIPKTLLNATENEWAVIMDGAPLSTAGRQITMNNTHTSIYFTYTFGIHNIQIITRELLSSNISISVSPDTVDVGSNVTISGDIDPVRENATVTIQYTLSGAADWKTIANVKTNSTSQYSYTWPTNETGTLQIKASWPGDSEYASAEDITTLTVKGAAAGIPLEYLAVAAVAIIAIVAVVVYFVKFRKPEEE